MDSRRLGDEEENNCARSWENEFDDNSADPRLIYPLHHPPDPCDAENEKYFDFLKSEGLPEEGTERGHVTLRQWLMRPHRTVDRRECLLIFAQVVEVVNAAHSRGLVLRNFRPSCLSLSLFNRISVNSFTSTCPPDNICNVEQKTSHDFQEYRTSRDSVKRGPEEPKQSVYYYDGNVQRHAIASSYSPGVSTKRRAEAGDEIKFASNVKEETNQEKQGSFQSKQALHMEHTWYSSPEELTGESCSFSSNIYSLGVLFFELFCTFYSEEEQWRIMSDLRHRVQPPHLLWRWPKEIAFCLSMLHPEPNQRPKLSEVLQHEIMNEARKVLLEWKAARNLEEEIADRELLHDFLIQVQRRKQEISEKLHKDVAFLTSDIEVVLNQQSILKHKGISPFDISEEETFMVKKGKMPNRLGLQLEQQYGTNIISRSSMLNVFSEKTGKTIMLGKQFQKGYGHGSMNYVKKLTKSNVQSEIKIDISRSGRMLTNFKELEKVYFSTTQMAKQFPSDAFGRYSHSSLGQGTVIRSGRLNSKLVNDLAGTVHLKGGSKSDRLGSFFDSLSKFLRFSKLEVKATLRQGDLLNSSGLVCSLSFDRDKEFFATAGINKKIKVFDCNTVMNEDMDIHYPVTEMISRSKLSSICWNSYIKNQIASSSFDGVVQLWDFTRNQALMEFEEHERRVWSVDFSQTDPRQLASGGDDGQVKLWHISQRGSIGSIKTNANVCSVQFAPDSPYQLALGSADHKIYCYDLRNIKKPWCILTSHKRTVSYVKFLDSSKIISASTDNTVKLWDLTLNTRGVLSNPVRTFTGHKNEKHFVGLSVADGYIATGSESNEVFVYHMSIPVPVACYKFNCVDTVNGHQIEDEAGLFVSSVCWRGQSQTLVAANSKGNIQILEMV